MKNIYALIAYFSIIHTSFAAKDVPTINCFGLPGCKDTNASDPSPGKVGENINIGAETISQTISLMLEYVMVLAVITLMISGLLYMFSGGEDEKVQKAKKWIIWSLLGVITSTSSWYIINLLNNFNFN